MNADALLSRLERVKSCGRGRWRAMCPAHDSKSGASLAITELDDGRVLLYDFGGCTVDEVLGRIGLTLEDLFPERPHADSMRRERRPWTIAQGLDVLDYEAGLICLAALNIGNGTALKPQDCERVLVAHKRIKHIIEVLRG